MRALLYIMLIAVVLWAGFAWEQASAPPLVVVTEEVVQTAPTAQTSAAPAGDIGTEVLPAAQSGPVGVAELPPAPPQVTYDEEYVELLELAIHKRINEERAAEGLKALAYDEALAQIAAYHSTDMAQNNYFDHEDEEGCDSSCRADEAGYRWRIVGENLFLLERDQHFSIEGASAIVVAGWLGSEGHRKNMFEPKFTEEGVGVVILGDSIYVTEMLALPR